MHFMGIDYLFREFLGGTGGLSIQVPFKTGFAVYVIAHHKNNNVLIPPYNQLKYIMGKFTVHIFLYLFFLYTTLKLYKDVLYNICFC